MYLFLYCVSQMPPDCGVVASAMLFFPLSWLFSLLLYPQWQYMRMHVMATFDVCMLTLLTMLNLIDQVYVWYPGCYGHDL